MGKRIPFRASNQDALRNLSLHILANEISLVSPPARCSLLTPLRKAALQLYSVTNICTL